MAILSYKLQIFLTLLFRGFNLHNKLIIKLLDLMTIVQLKTTSLILLIFYKEKIR